MNTSGTSGNNYLSGIFADTSQLKSNKPGTIVLSNSSGTSLKIDGTLVKEGFFSKFFGRSSNEVAKIKKDMVQLKLEEQGNGSVKVEVKIKDLADTLKTTEEKIKLLAKEKVLGEFISGRLQGVLIDKEIPTPKESSLPPPEISSKPSFKEAGPSEKKAPLTRSEVLENIEEKYAFDDGHLKVLENFYNETIKSLDKFKEPTLIHRAAHNPDKPESDLPFSVVIIPDGGRKGMYVLLKEHENIAEEVGRGAFNRATLAVRWDTGETKLFRSAKREDVKDGELEVNNLVADDPQHFTAGIPVYYKGDWRLRSAGLAGLGEFMEKEMDVEKIGLIMDYEVNGTLDKKYPFPSPEEASLMAKDYAEDLAALHKRGITHNDQKSGNTFLAAENRVKLGDFGMACKVGEKVTGGTLAYLSPERGTALKDDGVFSTSYSSDVWQMGCVFAEMFGKEDWYNYCLENAHDWKAISEESIKDMQDICFPDLGDPTSPDYIIARCLNPNPNARPTAERVLQMWDNLINRGSANAMPK